MSKWHRATISCQEDTAAVEDFIDSVQRPYNGLVQTGCSPVMGQHRGCAWLVFRWLAITNGAARSCSLEQGVDTRTLEGPFSLRSLSWPVPALPRQRLLNQWCYEHLLSAVFDHNLEVRQMERLHFSSSTVQSSISYSCYLLFRLNNTFTLKWQSPLVAIVIMMWQPSWLLTLTSRSL